MKYLSAAILAVIFALSAHYSWVWLLGYLLFFKLTAVGNIVRAMDCLLAAMLPFGWSGRNTVSKECGLQLVGGGPCRFCRVLCRILNYVLEKDHCQREV